MKKFLCSVMITALALGTVTAYANEKESRVVPEVIEEEVPPVDNNTIPGVLSYGLENITGLYEAIAEAEKGQTLTRDRLMQTLYEIEGEPGTVANGVIGVPYFDSEYEPAATWSYENEIMYGYGENRFGKSDFATREQLAAMLYRYCGAEAADSADIEDTDMVSEWAKESVDWAVENGILAVDENGMANPLGAAAVYDLNNALRILDLK